MGGNRLRQHGYAARGLAALLFLTLLPAAPAGASHRSLEDTRREIRATRAQLHSALRTDAEISAVLNRVVTQLRAQQALLAAARAHLSRIDLQIRAEQRRLARLEAAQRARQEVIAARARALYIIGPGDSLGAVAGSTSVQDFIARAGALEFVMSFDRRTLEDIATIEDQARKTKAALQERRVEAAKVRADIAERVALVAEVVAVKQAAHERVENRVDAYRAELAALQREQARIQAIIRTRSLAGSVDTGGASASGFAWPIRGRITSGYGPRWGGFHTGIDIDCRTGDAIGASKGGRVIASEYAGGYGRMVIVDHGGGYSTLYAHMSRLSVGYGQTVSQGQTVGACGSTGNSTGDHLHFEVRVNGNHRNPMSYLP